MSLQNNKHWNRIKSWSSWAARTVQIEMLATGVLFPIIECVFVNLYTGAPAGTGSIFGVALLAIMAIHASLFLMLLFRQGTNPVQISADAVELQEELDSVRSDLGKKITLLEEELARRTESNAAIRNIIDTLNLQTCQHEPASSEAFSTGIAPLIQRMACSARTTLGIRSDHFTIELFCYGYCVDPGCEDEQHLFDAYLFSSAGLNRERIAFNGHVDWGWNRHVPGMCNIEDDQPVFYMNGAPHPDIYFRRLAMVPVNAVCSPERDGMLMITSMQSEPFASDILETMQFFASVISQYIASHLRCVHQWRDEQKRQEEKRKRDERKAAKEAAKTESAPVQGPMDKPNSA